MDISELDPKTISALYSNGFLEADKINAVWGRSDVTVGEVMASWEGHLAQNRTKSGIIHLRGDISTFFQWLFEKKGVNRQEYRDQKFPFITPDDLNEYNKAAQSFSVDTIRRKRVSLDNFFDYCADRYSMLMPKVDLCVEPDREYIVPVHRKDEIEAIAESADILPKTLIMLIFETGMKRAEVLDCRIEHTDLDADMIRIVGAQGETQRIVTFSHRMETLLWDYLTFVENSRKEYNDSREAEYLETGRRYRYRKKSPYLFCSKRAEKLPFAIMETEIKMAGWNYFYNEKIVEAETPVQAKAYADERSAKFTTEALRGSKKAYMIASGKSLEQVSAAMGEVSTVHNRRFVQIARQLYPEKY